MSQPLMVKALRGQDTSRIPVWFMRQAGAHFPEHREIFEEHGVRGITKNPELDSKVTLLPVEKLDVDAAVMYADIILPLEDMGIEFHYGEGEEGPIIHNPIKTAEDVDELRILKPRRGVSYILESIRRVRESLNEDRALVGFSGGPFTLAGYMIEGEASRTFPITKQFMHNESAAFHRLMELLSKSITGYLESQADSGIDVIQLFDSWIGALSPGDYREFVHPYHKRIFENLSPLDPPTITFGTNVTGFLEDFVSAGADAVSLDWRINLDSAGETIGTNRVIQGNLDPAMTLANDEVLNKEINDILTAGEQFDGHVFNLGHRIPRNVEPGQLKRIVDIVHEY